MFRYLWSLQIALWTCKARGLTRRIAVILHRIWVDGTTFQPDAAPKVA